MKKQNNNPLWKLPMIFLISILFGFSTTLFAQEISVKGIVVDEQQEALIGVNVMIKGTKKTTVTNATGAFSISATKSEVLVFSYLGMLKQEIVVQDTKTLKIVLKQDTKTMDEVVVVGYGVQKKSLVTGAISSVSAKEFERPGMMRADEVLQGKTAGVTVMANSGQPGENLSIRIRGVGTNGNSSPLFIVDGMPYENIEFLNPRDIESMEVLKDAASSAIYGARGANGVVIIGTKKGKNGDKMTIKYDFSYGVQNLRKKMDLLDARSYAIIQNEAAFNGGQSLPFTANDIIKLGKGTDWQEEILNKNAPISNHQLSFSGGSEKTTYNLSASIFNQEGIFAPGKSNFDRMTLREATDHNYFDGHFKVGQSLTIAIVDKKGIDPNNTFGGPILGALNMDPVTPVRNADGTYGQSLYVAQEVVNPVAKLSTVFGGYKYTQLLANAYAELSLFKDFKMKSSISSDMFFDNGWGYSPIYQLNTATMNTITGVNKSMSNAVNINFENTITYNHLFGKHNVMGMIGNTMLTNNYNNLYGSKQGLLVADPNFAYLDLATIESSARTAGGASHGALVSYFGRLNYDYNSRYMLTATFRADGSTKFGTNNRFGYFPSFSAGWNITNESFMKEQSALESLKLRASWGQNGNDKIGDWQYLATVSSGARGYTYNDVIYAGVSPTKVANPDLKWETSEQINIGLDTRFLKKFNFVFDYYIKNTKDLLLESSPIPLYVGNNPPTTNIASVQNKGVELSLGYNDRKGDFSWNVDFNISYNKNVVTAVDRMNVGVQGASIGTAITDATRMDINLPISYIKGYVTEGIFQNQAEVLAYKNSKGVVIQPEAMPGDFRYKDLNDDGIISPLDRTMIGKTNPDFIAGLTLGLSWKDLSISGFFSGMSGNNVINATRRWDLPMSNYQSDVLNRWVGEGTSTTYPRVSTTDVNKNFSRLSSFFVEDGSFLRMKNLTIAYNFKNLQKILVQNLRLYVAASNLFTLTKYSGLDPEIGSNWVLGNGIDYGAYPQARTYTVGATINF